MPQDYSSAGQGSFAQLYGHFDGHQNFLPPQSLMGNGNRWACASASTSASTSTDQSISPNTGSNSGSPDVYFSREEIDRCSPSRRDGIDFEKESFLRHSYCSFLQDLGMRMQLPQTTIAAAMVLCHRFFLRRSHALYDRFMIATACIFLAAKSEDNPRPINSVAFTSYEMSRRQDLASFHYNMPKDWFEQYKEQVFKAENCVLTTLDFELTVEHPYKPLHDGLYKIGLAGSALVKIGSVIVTDTLCSSLCLQFQPHHIAAGAVFLAARALKFDLPSSGLVPWWQVFQTTPAILNCVVWQMLEQYGKI